MLRRMVWPVAVILLLIALSTPVLADEQHPTAPSDDPLTDLPSDLWDAIPEQLRPLLPEGVQSGDAESILREMDGKRMLRLMWAFLKEAS